ncbi:MAG: hypothetical protein IJN11_05700 [Oscillospiraceae bacterium]|nr:hypothetical protein [Oscillospiraceae bacterium]
MLTLDDALQYLGYDEVDDMIRKIVSAELAAAEQTMLGAVGEDVREYMPEDPRIDELVRIYLDDLHDERGVSAKVSGATRRLVQSLELQLQLHLQRTKEAEGV